jgi:decaprenylphospho-beta-D-erythro-pentofuranosid-2-ulose 2-reductase
MSSFNPRRILVLGGNSAIAIATARRYVTPGTSFVLVGRQHAALVEVADDLVARGSAQAHVIECDLAESDSVSTVLSEAQRSLGGFIDLVLLAYGVLGSQAEAEQNLESAASIIQTNFSSAAIWCLATARLFESQGHGRLAVIGSVAGDRGRQSNYVYGATKAGLGTLVAGLAHRFAKSDIRVTLIKPGFVKTPMTAAITRKGALWASPDQVANGIVKAISRGVPDAYVPGFWRLIMLVIRAIPWLVFSRTKL